MVRQKNRWLLVQLDFEDDILSSCLSADAAASNSGTNKKRKLQLSNSNISAMSSAATANQIINTTDIYRSLQDIITQNYGLVGACTTNIQVLLYDPKVRLAIIKTSRDTIGIVRSSITLMTQIKQGGDVLKVAASTIAVNGSVRTARNAAWEELQKRFYNSSDTSCTKEKGKDWTKKRRIAMERGLQDLESRLEKIGS